MRNKILAILLMLPLLALAGEPKPSLIPLPQQFAMGEGQFVLPKTLSYFTDAYPGDSIALVFKHFGDNLTATTSICVKPGKESKAAIRLKHDASLGAEAYTLSIDRRHIRIAAARPAGFFYALQTLMQLLPSRSVLAGAKDNASRMTLPVVEIKDEPRFAWRGFMLDESRHFFGKEEVKRVLDVMARYKMNRFHWHLTDDQGWRVEIKQYPRLTEVGAWRDSKALVWEDTKSDGQRYGGFYSHEDIHEIVSYAAERFIEIVPEIDIPGHSQAAVAAYPELLACDLESDRTAWLAQGVSSDVINVAKPSAVKFANDVIDELAGLFPFGYLHLGGDECPTDKWQQNAECQQRMKAMKFTDYRDLQLDFYRQLQQHIAQKPQCEQRKLIFWNEVLHGNTSLLSPDITIMAWVGADKAARAAAAKGLNTILTPQIPYYINRKQSDLPTEPHSQGRGTETVKAVYDYVPMKDIPDSLQSRYMGVQANFWSEWVEDAPRLEYLMLPRLAAVAEAGWTRQALRDYSDFQERLQAETAYYQLKGMDYGRHVFKR